MGGGAENGHGGDFRAKVWSMSGGPYCRPKHWRRNTAFAMFGVFLVCIPIAMKSAELEVSRSFEICSIQSYNLLNLLSSPKSNLFFLIISIQSCNLLN